MPYPAYKPCTKCGVVKPEKEFELDRRKEGRRLARCRECRRQEKSAWERANRDKVQARLKRRRRENPDKQHARQAIAKALERGQIEKPNKCEDCGGEFPSRQIHAHHEDYSKRMDVEWLCRQCHDIRHDVLAG